MAVRLRKFVIIYDGLKSLDLNDGKSQITNSKKQINSNDSNSKNQTRIDLQKLQACHLTLKKLVGSGVVKIIYFHKDSLSPFLFFYKLSAILDFGY